MTKIGNQAMTDAGERLALADGWSCDERNRAACRNGHGCHCREITALRASAVAVDRDAEKIVEQAIADFYPAWERKPDFARFIVAALTRSHP